MRIKNWRQFAKVALTVGLVMMINLGSWTRPPRLKMQSKRSRFMTGEMELREIGHGQLLEVSSVI